MKFESKLPTFHAPYLFKCERQVVDANMTWTAALSVSYKGVLSHDTTVIVRFMKRLKPTQRSSLCSLLSQGINFSWIWCNEFYSTSVTRSVVWSFGSGRSCVQLGASHHHSAVNKMGPGSQNKQLQMINVVGFCLASNLLKEYHKSPLMTLAWWMRPTNPMRFHRRDVWTDQPATGSSGMTLLLCRSRLVVKRLQVHPKTKRLNLDRVTGQYKNPRSKPIETRLIFQPVLRILLSLPEAIVRHSQLFVALMVHVIPIPTHLSHSSRTTVNCFSANVTGRSSVSSLAFSWLASGSRHIRFPRVMLVLVSDVPLN